MDKLPLPVLVAGFTAAAALIWLAGYQLSRSTDAISEHFHLGEALGGLILLAVATNLPEMAIVGAAAVRHNFDIATGNILGGIAIQTVVLVLLDIATPVRHALSDATRSLTQVLEGTVVVAVCAVVVMGTLLPKQAVVARIDPAALLIAVVWLVGLWLTKRAKALPWASNREGDQDSGGNKPQKAKSLATPVALAVFAVAALVTLGAGVAVEITGNAIATDIHLNGVVFGGTILAAATALPEVSTGLAAVRMRDYELAVSDIFGGNAFLPVLFLPATILSGQSVLGAAQHTDVLLACLGILLTTVYVVGMLFRPRGQWLRMGPDSITVLALYGLGVAALVAVSGGK
ncbi:MAG: sodium:calcium antiporter [Candidatus Dormibacteraeota bacterium]|nr:sodium:calcium antiporter [Candidatus Dormibacteraeota bacterium]